MHRSVYNNDENANSGASVGETSTSGEHEFYDAIPIQHFSLNRRNDYGDYSDNMDYDVLKKSVSTATSRVNVGKGEAAANALAKAFYPDLSDDRSSEFTRKDDELRVTTIDNNNALLSPAATSNVTFRKRNYANGSFKAIRSKVTRDFQRRRRETKAALVEKLPWRLKAVSILLAMCAGFTIVLLIFGLLMMFLMSGVTYRPEFDI